VSEQTRELWASEDPRRPKTEGGQVLDIPAGWQLLPPGDAAVTRRVKAAGPSWLVKKKRGRRVFSQGIWAPAETIATVQAQVEAERADPKYAKRLEAGRARRQVAQANYVEEFGGAVRLFLAFAPRHAKLQADLATAIAEHATPVGSGTVARTERIPVERRAEAATIAWLRHHTTGYDDMKIPRVKGMRREVRRLLAERSRRMLASYRRGDDVGSRCPLRAALDGRVTDPPAPR
jgi:hypothetical protein